MKTGNQNEHGIDSLEFMMLASPHRWSCVQNFLEDLNGTFSGPFTYVDLNYDHSPCFRNPDTALMEKEAINMVDLECDKRNIFGEQRRIIHWAEDKLGQVWAIKREQLTAWEEKVERRKQQRKRKQQRRQAARKKPPTNDRPAWVPTFTVPVNVKRGPEGLLGNWEPSGFTKADYNRLHDIIYLGISKQQTNEQLRSVLGDDYDDYVLNALRRKFEWLESNHKVVANNIRLRLGIDPIS